MPTHWKNPGNPPKSPFYAVIFISIKNENPEGYAEMDERMMELASQQEGFLGYSSVAQAGQSIFISYWQSAEAIDRWRHNPEHREAKSRAQEWYAFYHSMITKVETNQMFNALVEEYT